MFNVYYEGYFFYKEELFISETDAFLKSFETATEAAAFIDSKPPIEYQIVKLTCEYRITPCLASPTSMRTRALAEFRLAKLLAAIDELEKTYAVKEYQA